jgi:hypothetical protein
MQVQSREKQPGKKLRPNRAETGLGRPAWVDRPSPFWARLDAPFDLATSRVIYSLLVESHEEKTFVIPRRRAEKGGTPFRRREGRDG